MSDDKDRNKNHEEKHIDRKDHIEYKEWRDKAANREIIIEKMQRPEPWPNPPSEDSDSND